MARMGQVNLRAIEDYEDRKARYDSLRADVERLNAQIKELNELVALSIQRRRALHEVLRGHRQQFQKMYSELSGRGSLHEAGERG